MSVLTTLGVFNYGLVLLYGLFLSTFISGGWENTKQRTLVFAACPLFLMIQSVCWLALGADMARQLYPLITHLPLALILICILKKKVDVALVSICTAYLCCQLPRWVDLVVTALTRSELIGEICYTLVIGPLFYLLYRFFVRPAYAAMMASPQSLLLFGSLPVAYYFFDYATVVYSDALYRGYGAINEFLPTALIIFYVMFLTAYHAQSSRRAQAEMQSTMLEAGLKQLQIEVDALRRAEVQTAVYQHDMRHHLNAIDGFLAAGKPQQAEEYISKVRSDIERITPKRYCDNELVNLLCSSFAITGYFHFIPKTSIFCPVGIGLVIGRSDKKDFIFSCIFCNHPESCFSQIAFHIIYPVGGKIFRHRSGRNIRSFLSIFECHSCKVSFLRCHSYRSIRRI